MGILYVLRLLLRRKFYDHLELGRSRRLRDLSQISRKSVTNREARKTRKIHVYVPILTRTETLVRKRFIPP